MGQTAPSASDVDGPYSFFLGLDLEAVRSVVDRLGPQSSASVSWKQFFEVFLSIQSELAQSRERFARNQWSPVCTDYAMSKQTGGESDKERERERERESPRAESASPSVADWHTDDERSVDGEEESDAAPVEAEHAYAAPVSAPHRQQSEHPVFFGYSTESAREQKERRDLATRLQRDREEKSMERAIAARASTLDQMEAQFQQQSQTRAKRIEQLKQDYEKEQERKRIEFGKQIVDVKPSIAATLKAQYEKSKQLYAIAFEREYNEMVEKNELKSEQDKQILNRKRQELSALIDSKQFNSPIGSRLKDFCKAEILRCAQELSDALAAAQRLSNELISVRVELNNLLASNDPQTLKSKHYHELRSMVNVAETRLKEALRTVSARRTDGQDAEALLLCAATLEKQEQKVLPLFQRLCEYELNMGFSSSANHVQATILVVSLLLLCQGSFEMKCNFIFSMFNDQHKGLFDMQFVLSVGRYIFLALQALRFVRSTVSLREVENQIIRLFMGFSTNFQSDHISEYEAKLLLSKFVAKDVVLMKIFSYAMPGRAMISGSSGVGNYMLSEMSSIGLIDTGIADKRDVIHRVHFYLQRHSPALEPARKRTIHDQALSLGQYDNLRADYSMFFTKKEKAGSYFVTPLDTGARTSLQFHRSALTEKASIKLQSFARLMLHRKLAERNSKRVAFNEAKLAVVKQLKNRILKEFQQREASKGIGKMKWDTEVRMKQAKLRSQGQNMSRNDTVMLMIEETIALAKAQIDARFEQFQPPSEEPREEKKEHIAAPVWQLFGLPFTIERQETNAIIDAERQEENTEKDAESSAQTGNESESGNRDSIIVRKRYTAEELLSAFSRYWEVLSAQENARELLHIGEETVVTIFRRKMAAAEVEMLSHLFHRFTLASSSITAFKAQEILREFPSKRLLIKYVTNISESLLKDDLVTQFKFANSPRLNQYLTIIRNIVEYDVDAGVQRRHGLSVEQRLERFLAEQSFMYFRSLFDGNWNRLSKKSDREEIEEEDRRLLSHQNQIIQVRKSSFATFEEQRKKLRLFSLSLRRLEEYRTAFQSHVSPVKDLSPLTRRFDWMWRIREARRALQSELTRAAVDELSCVLEEFKYFSTTIAQTVIDELFREEEEKTVRVVARRPINGRAALTGRGVNGHRFVFEACNIFFHVALDYDGAFNGSDDFAAKVAGKERLGAQLLADLDIAQLSPALTATIDLFGFRIVATAQMPIAHISFGEDGLVQNEHEELVHGIDSKGLNFISKSKKAEDLLRAVGGRMNLRSHYCKGKLDTVPSTSISARLKVYRGSDDRFYVRQCAALFPMELSSDTAALVSAPRDQCIFWRLLRPELTRKLSMSVSVDAGAIIAAVSEDETLDWKSTEECSRELLSSIRSLANSLLAKNIEFPVPLHASISLSKEFHRFGVSVRHAGKLRSLLWRKVPAKVSVFHYEQFLRSSADLRLEIDDGESVYVEGCTFPVKSNAANRFTFNRVPLNTVYSGNSVHRVDVWAGFGEKGDLQAHENLRLLLLAEMTARAMKNTIRLQLRQYCERNKTISSLFFRELIAEYLNCVSGSSMRTEELFQDVLPSIINERFGNKSLRPSEMYNISQLIVDARVFIIRRLSDMLGFRLGFSCLSEFEKRPSGFVFNRDDVSPPSALFRVSVSDSPFLQAAALSFAAQDIVAGAYSQRIVADSPLVFFTFSERKGSRTVANKGTLGVKWAGAITEGCLLELSGPVKGEKFVKAIGFRSVFPSVVDIKYDERLVPQDFKQPFSVELFFRCCGAANAQRTIFASGRCALRVTRDEHLVFSLYEEAFTVSIKVDKISTNGWMHIVVTFDGVFLRVYKDGVMCAEVDTPPLFEAKRRLFESEHRERLAQLRVDEQMEKDALQEKVVKEATHFFQSKEGSITLKRMVQVILDLEEGDVALIDDGVTGIDRVRERKAMAVKKAKEKYIEEQLQSQMREVAMRFKQMVLDVEDHHLSKLRDAKLKSFEPFRLGAALPDANNRDGSEFFDGDLSCFSVFYRCLSPDKIRLHFLSSKRDSSIDANRLYAQSVTHFNAAMFEIGDVQMKHAPFLDLYAKALCFLLCFEPEERDAQRSAAVTSSLLNLIEEFGRWERLETIAHIVNNVPRDQEFADVIVAAILTIKSRDKRFLSKSQALQRRTLVHFPFDFSLISANRPQAYYEAAAFIFQEVVGDVDLMFVYGDVDLRWLYEVKSAKLVIALVRAAFEDKSTKMVRVREFFSDRGELDMMICDEDVQVLAQNLPLSEGFDFTDCPALTDDAMRSLARLGNIRVLVLDNCSLIADEGFKALRAIAAKFETLSMEQLVRVSDASFCTVVDKCTRLKHLNVNKCPLISISSVAAVARNNINLEVLGLSGLPVADESLMFLSSELKNCRISSLDLSHCERMTDLGLIAIADACSSLKSINLFQNARLSTEGVRALCCRCWSLENIGFEGLFMITDDIFLFSPTVDGRAATSDRMLSCLREVNMKGCDFITDKALHHLSERCRSVTSMVLHGCKKITDKGLSYLADPLSCPSASQSLALTLRKLDLSFVSMISSHGLLETLRECKNLETLGLTGLVRVVDDQFLKHIGGICPSIQNLSIGLCVAVSDVGLCSVAEGLWIENLDLSGCYKTTDMGIEVLASCCTGLKVIDISKCKRITGKSIALLKKNCPNLIEMIGHTPTNKDSIV